MENVTAWRIFSCGGETTRNPQKAQTWLSEGKKVEVVMTDGTASKKVPIREIYILPEGGIEVVTEMWHLVRLERVDLGKKNCSVINFWARNEINPKWNYIVEEQVAKAIVKSARTPVRAEVILENGVKVLTSEITEWDENQENFKTINGSVYSYTVVEE